MCGIIVTLSRNAPKDLLIDDVERLKARGPDSLFIHHVSITAGSEHRFLTFAASVLSLRGDKVCAQPLIDHTTGSVFCWNGEAWKFDGADIEENDSRLVFDTLLYALANTVDVGGGGAEKRSSILLDLLTRITGPYAFVFYDAPTSTLYYGRDRLGRRSLNISRHSVSVSSDNNYLMTISSTNLQSSTVNSEVDTAGIHCIKLLDHDCESFLLPWPATSQSINQSIPDHSLQPLPPRNSLLQMQEALCESLRLRVMQIPTYNITNTITGNPCKLAILFSGGLDCTLLARLCHDLLPKDQSIDLLNVAFENPRTIRAAAASRKQDHPIPSAYESCPDRTTGRMSHAELRQICPDRSWRFVAINVPYEEATAHRSTIIDLMKPHNTEMDLSIAMALYFAARGQGTVDSDDDPSLQTAYTTPARVLLSGLGADELFGGYARHAAAFSRSGWQSLIDELELDFTRIGSRNLGRDDRVMSHWAREVRYPYLDEDFTRFALSLPVWEKVGFRSGKHIPKHFEEASRGAVQQPEDLDPAKLILRYLAWEMGMKGVAAEKKRAIQFGARTAKMEGGRTKGTDALVA